MKSTNTVKEIVIKAKGLFCVEDWFTEELIEVFETFEDRQKWIDENVNANGYTKEGRKISIYEDI